MRGLRRLAAVVDGEGLLEAEHAADGTGAGAVLPEVAE
jgi:hypothetical protein